MKKGRDGTTQYVPTVNTRSKGHVTTAGILFRVEKVWVGSSEVEHRAVNPADEGSIPSPLANCDYGVSGISTPDCGSGGEDSNSSSHPIRISSLMDRVPGFDPEGCRFKSCLIHHECRRQALLSFHTGEYVGSIPTVGTKFTYRCRP